MLCKLNKLAYHDTHVSRFEGLDPVPDDCVPDPTMLEIHLEELLKTNQVLTEFLT